MTLSLAVILLLGASPGKPATHHQVILPPAFDARFKLTPVVFALHGYGGNAEETGRVWKDACAEVGAILIVPQGANDLGAGRFAWSGSDDAGANIEAARKELAKKYPLHRFAPRVLVGMSQGGWITYSLALQYPKTYRRLIPVAGMLHWKTQEAAKDFTDEQKKDMKHWHVYIMTGIKDENPLVADNRRVAGQLEQIGVAVKAPFADRRDPSWKLYQDLGHDFPGRTASARNKELVRALKFVLQPDDEDRRNWSKVDPDWATKARWSQETPATKKRDSRKNPTGN